MAVLWNDEGTAFCVSCPDGNVYLFTWDHENLKHTFVGILTAADIHKMRAAKDPQPALPPALRSLLSLPPHDRSEQKQPPSSIPQP